MRLPGRKELAAADPYAGVARGEQVNVDGSRHGTIDDGNVAWPERVAEARRCWPEARASDFQQTGKRRFVDRATGRAYRQAAGAPLLAIATESTRGISTWFVSGGSIVFLEPEDYPRELRGPVGYVRSQVVSAASPGLEGARIW
jgi:hypothetical protein